MNHVRAAVLRLAAVLLLASVGQAQDVPLDVSGGGVSRVKVDRIVVVKEDATLVTAFPCTVKAPTGGILYQWSYPATVEAVKRGNALEIRSAPKGPLTVAVEFAVVDFKAQTVESKTGTASFFVGDIPTPPPTPPGPTPPPVPPTPTPTGPLKVLILEESGKRTPAFTAAVYAKSTRDYLNAKCGVDPDGKTKTWTVQDKDTDLSKYSKGWEDLRNRARTELPWIIIADMQDRLFFEGALPGTPDDLLALLKKYGG